MKEIPTPDYNPERPKFSWIKCCNKCPSRGKADPEMLDIMSWSFKDRIDTTFPCAWRTEGYCYLNSKKTYYADDSVI